jgi:transposase, IS605 OrfB family, central region
VEKAYTFRIYPTAEQEQQIQETFGSTRFVFNHFLARRMRVYETEKRTLGYYECSAELTELKKKQIWLKEADSTALQSALQDLEDAYKGFFRRVKKGEVPGFPRFKSKKYMRKSYRSKRVGQNIAFDGYRVKLPKLGWVEAKGYTAIKGRILNATISQSLSGKYFVSLCCTEVDIVKPNRTGAQIGLDFGLKTHVMTSDGQSYANHRYLRQSEKKLIREQRKLSRKPIGSKNRAKQRIRVARLHEKIANQRTDNLHKLSTALVLGYDLICIEDLTPSKMMRNRRLAKAIADVSWSEFRRQLAYKCAWYGKTLQVVGRFYASSQICSVCSHQNAEAKDMSVRRWICPVCGAQHDRDVNAAKNILCEGLRLLAVAN